MAMESRVMRDLKLRVETPFLIYPAEPTVKRSIFLSNIDQTLVATIETVLFFDGANVQMSFDQVVQRLTDALSRLLVPYDFMAGRLEFNVDQERHEINCNAAGALFAVASSMRSLQDLGDLNAPNPALKQLILHDLHALKAHLPLFTVQATHFRCGGLAFGVGLNHALLDGISSFDFMVNLASVARGEGLVVTPYVERSLLKARMPTLRIGYEHLEYSKLSDIPPGLTTFSGRGPGAIEAAYKMVGYQPDQSCCMQNIAPRKHILKLFTMSGETLNRLKEKAMEDGRVRKCTSFEAVTAHLWRARTQAVMQSHEVCSTVLFPVDIRSRMEPPLPREFAGNAVVPGYAKATVKEVQEAPFSVLVTKVQQGLRRITDCYVRSAIDWLEVHKGIPCACDSFSVVSWWRLGLEEVEYPWGRPVYIGPVMVDEAVELVMLLPSPKQEGLSIVIALEPRQMAKFQQRLEAL